MDKITLEEHLVQPLEPKNKQFKLAITFLNGYNGMFNVTNKNSEFYFTVSIFDDDFSCIYISTKKLTKKRA